MQPLKNVLYSLIILEIREISHKEAKEFLLPRHYSGRIPTISKSFGWYDNDKIKAVVTFGKPASPQLCYGICGKEYSNNVYELNRLCREEDLEKQLSEFLGGVLRIIKKQDWIIVSYSDTQMNHHGYIYQSCNFIYTGMTKKRTDMYTENGKHSRHYKNEMQNGLRKVRSPKHRYVYFCTNKKWLRNKWMQNLRYNIQDYPKGDNKNYVLGEYLKDEIIDTRICK